LEEIYKKKTNKILRRKSKSTRPNSSKTSALYKLFTYLLTYLVYSLGYISVTGGGSNLSTVM